MLVVDRFIKLLDDGKWHSIGETMERAEVKANVRKPLLNFLAEYDFVEVDKGRVRLSSSFLPFLRATKNLSP